MRGDNMLDRNSILSRVARSDTPYDVLVAGAGPAGIGAALAAASCGARTAVIEARGFFGGVAAVSHWMPMNRLLLQGETRGGVHGMFVDKIRQLGPEACRPGKTSWVDGDGLHIHPEYLRLAVYELFEEAGCDYRLYAPVTGAEWTGPIRVRYQRQRRVPAAFRPCLRGCDRRRRPGVPAGVRRVRDASGWALMAVR
jgi:flavin-dependent dehydrogenase